MREPVLSDPALEESGARGRRRVRGRLLGLSRLSGVLGGLVWAGTPLTPVPAQQLTRPLPPPLATAAAPLVLRGVTVIDVRTGRRLPNRTVVVAGTHIQALGRAGRVRVPRTAQVIDARGKYLIPGLWDMHVHTKEFADVAYPLFIANGVTGVRDAGSNVPLATLGEWKREIAQGTRVGPRLIVSGPIIEDRIPDDPGDTVNVIQGTDRSAHRISVPRAAAQRVVDSLHAAGADMLKIYMPSREMRLALMAEAKRVGIPFGGHAGGGMSGQEFSDSGAAIIDHEAFTWEDPSFNVCGEGASAAAPLAHFDGPRCAAAVKRLWQNGTWVATGGGANVFERYTARRRRYVATAQAYRAVWDDIQRRMQGDTARLDSLVAAQEPTSGADWERLLAAVDTGPLALGWVADKGRPALDSLRKYQVRLPVVIGMDTHLENGMIPSLPGFAVHDALVVMTQRRTPPCCALYVQPTRLAALQTATLNPALALRATDSLGTVERGKVADLVLLDADPLEDIWNTTKIRAVIAGGRYYDRAALDRLLQAAHEAAVASRVRVSQP